MKGEVNAPALEIEHLSKAFPGQLALDDVSLTIAAGEVHGLVGQNGAGKSTLIKTLAGYHEPEPGAAFRIRGEPYDPRHMGHERRVGFVHQDLALVPTLSAAENISLIRGFATGRDGGIRWRTVNRDARELIAPFGVELDVGVPVSQLTPVQRAVVAMARATQGTLDDTAVLVLDEPTAALPAPEVARLIAAVRRFAESGGGVLYVSHRLEEVLSVADRVTVLRNGRAVATEDAWNLDHQALVSHILGTSLDVARRPSPAAAETAPCLEVQGLRGGNVQGVSFTLAKGEVLGVAGIVGSGREDLAALLFGSRLPLGGRVRVCGEDVALGSPRASLEHGIAYVPADRAREGLVMRDSVRENMLLPRVRGFASSWKIDRRAERREAQGWIERLGVTPTDPERRVSVLSGGNQQKVVLARALGLSPKVLVLDEPGQGTDVGARRRILELIGEASREGIGVIFCTSESEDLPSMCHRVLVLRGGFLDRELQGEAITEHEIMAAGLSEVAA